MERKSDIASHEESVTAALSAFVATFPSGSIDPGAIAEMRRTLANYVGCVVGGSRHDTIEKLLATSRPFFGAPTSALFGRVERADALHAALVNGTSNNVFGYDDTHLDTIVHPGGPVLAALFALTGIRPFSGQMLLEAAVMGIEVTCRVARALNDAHVDRGWHVSSTAGTFGSAAACARILGLESDQVARAFAIAASQPTGMRSNFGTATVSLHIGLAARSGLQAALLARNGFSSHVAIFDQPKLWGDALTPEFDQSALVKGLGESFEIRLNSYKPYGSGIVTHPVIDGCRDLSEAHNIDPDQVAGIELIVHPLVHELTGRLPTTALRSKVSVQHAAAVGIARRAGGPAEFNEAALHDPAIARLRNLVSYTVDESLARDEAKVSIRLGDGSVLSTHVKHARGSRARPMTEGDLRQKFLALTAEILPRSQSERLFDMCLEADKLSTAADIADAACPSGNASSAAAAEICGQLKTSAPFGS